MDDEGPIVDHVGRVRIVQRGQVVVGVVPAQTVEARLHDRGRFAAILFIVELTAPAPVELRQPEKDDDQDDRGDHHSSRVMP